MKRFVVGALFCALMSAAAVGASKEGDSAPDFTVQAAVGGKTFFST